MKFLAFFCKNKPTDHMQIKLETGEKISPKDLQKLLTKIPSAQIKAHNNMVDIYTPNTTSSGIKVFQAAKSVFGPIIQREPLPRNRRNKRCLVRVP